MVLILGLTRFVLHLLIVWGLWLVVRPLLEQGYRQFTHKLELGMDRGKNRFGRRFSSTRYRLWLYRHLDQLLYLSGNRYEPGSSVLRFSVQTFLLFIGVYVSCGVLLQELPLHLHFSNPFLSGSSLQREGGSYGAWRFSLFLAILAALVPYLKLRYRYAERKVRASYDLLDVVKLATKFTHFSVDTILLRTADLLGPDNVLKTPLRLLGASFSGYSNEAELGREASRFAAAIGTTFAAELVSDLLYCEKEGTRFLKSSLMLLNRSMEQQRETILNVKANSRDAISLGLYGNLVVLVSSVGTFMYMLKPDVYFKLQFETPAGLTFMTVIIAGLFLSFVISTILSRPKLDYH